MRDGVGVSIFQIILKIKKKIGIILNSFFCRGNFPKVFTYLICHLSIRNKVTDFVLHHDRADVNSVIVCIAMGR